ncbi:SDR family NAD(P)-dependent oxidoreductase [Mycobacterium sp. M1]|uniref:SDR family NAD(P)-dependent oxidoreductase n=1 Tax=Mycolicibacter acidiphilus TaxID=2835306 RepID=A0ABS5RGT0_9MYCO|nr:SDR family NAD(P)-dependent oxidoreductase [Mycolicibacter acidiphilus]MBS9533503.1 SDR family NAD(P)-dependent oxidoreductase [Mycolicibacter acidiphilus]
MEMQSIATRRADGTAGRLVGRTAVVTGASSGIGRSIALRLAAEGAAVTAVGRSGKRLDTVVGTAAGRNGAGEITAAQVDLTDDGARRAFVSWLARGPRVDLLVHSVGLYRRAQHADAALADLDDMYATNVRGPYALTQELLPMLRAAEAADIVMMNSTAGLRAAGHVGQYAATQHALKAIADSLRQEVNADGIRVCSMHLGRTATPLQEDVFRAEGRPYNGQLLVQPDDVAEVVVNVVSLPERVEVPEVHLRPSRASY